MRVEAYAASLMQDGHRANEDAFVILREGGTVACAALCDGAGNAQGAARRALRQFELLFKAATPEEIASPAAWHGWTKVLDSTLMGAAESTFVAAAPAGDRFVGVCAGDSRVYLRTRAGELHILSDGANKKRLGSGQTAPFPFSAPAARGDMILLMSDGAWTPFSLPRLKEAIARGATLHLSERPSALLELASRTGRYDDMTVVLMACVG